MFCRMYNLIIPADTISSAGIALKLLSCSVKKN